MMDYQKIIDNMRNKSTGHREEAASAIENLLAENERLKAGMNEEAGAEKRLPEENDALCRDIVSRLRKASTLCDRSVCGAAFGKTLTDIADDMEKMLEG